ncbi:MAG: Tyrosine recombinase XerC [Candidatus Azambacteria bacterium GW2011_GWA1_44_9]|uniref:Tyrosine recombinase XerC n=1 Tax=Candidatus Azambacteria bacterium GW2011_GWA1_44_9 TaxID=1618610 RepID=A0A0G1MIN3_9BACT|nr:MAG: Tyrosine recombinase XerC [Candidatus Azambacteria bacterium GW2011_GWA1_44_9]
MKESLKSHVPDFLDWLDIEKGLSSKSQENYAHFVKHFFDWLEKNKIGSITPQAIREEHVWKYKVYLSRHKSLKRSTQNYYLIALRSLLSYLMEKGITSLPPDKIRLAREKEKQQIRFLTKDQLKKFFDGPDTSTFLGLRDRAILEILFSTGLRIAELVNLNREQIKIPRNPSEELEIVITGKGRRVRPVYFSSRSLHWLNLYLKARTDTNPALLITYRNYKTKVDARRISHRTIQTAFKKYAVLSGIPLDTTPHVMRHSFATDLLSQGVDIRTIQEFLGHKNIAATQIYAHLTSKQLKETHKKFHSKI